MPASGLGREVDFNRLHVLPLSIDQLWATVPSSVLHRICIPLLPYVKIVGWIVLNSFPSLMGPITSHVFPRSLVNSKWTSHLSLPPASNSVLEGHIIVPLASWIGLFFTGPNKLLMALSLPSRFESDHVRPSSSEVISMPHHALG